MYDVNYTELLLDGTRQADPSWPTRGCTHGWEFNFTDVPYETVATEVRGTESSRGSTTETRIKRESTIRERKPPPVARSSSCPSIASGTRIEHVLSSRY